MSQSVSSGAFEISWHEDFGYRVSVPNLLQPGERLLVAPVGEREQRVKAAADELGQDVVGNWSRMTLLTWAAAILDAADRVAPGPPLARTPDDTPRGRSG